MLGKLDSMLPPSSVDVHLPYSQALDYTLPFVGTCCLTFFFNRWLRHVCLHSLHIALCLISATHLNSSSGGTQLPEKLDVSSCTLTGFGDAAHSGEWPTDGVITRCWHSDPGGLSGQEFGI